MCIRDSYLVARWCGVKIDAFSLGFGPEIYAWTDKRGTRWRLAAIPVGGYVKFRGDANAASAPDLDGVAAMAPFGPVIGVKRRLQVAIAHAVRQGPTQPGTLETPQRPAHRRCGYAQPARDFAR